jgi:two-component system, chemotaxis family, CheB/CheR fusion protein
MTQSRTGSGWTNHCDTTTPESFAFDPVEILESIEVPLIVIHRDFTIACFNRAAAETLGLTPSNIGRSARDVAGFAELQNLERWCAQVISTGIPSRYDFHYEDKTFVLRISSYAKHNHELYGTVLTFMNVTAFRASIDAAIYEREYTKAILNTGTDPFIVLSQDLRLQTANRAFYEMFGVTREVMHSISLDALENGAFNLASLRAQLQEMFANGCEFQPFEVEHNFSGAGRRTLMLAANPFSLPGNSRRMILLMFRDITMRKEAEASNARISAIVQSSDDAIVSEDLNGIITSWNRGAQSIFGYSPDEAIGKSFTILILEEGADEEPKILERIRRGDRIDPYETVRRRKNGSLVDVSLSVSPIIDERGAIIGISKIARDITQRKRAEEALRAADHAKDEFLAMLGHELRNPLGALASAVRILDLAERSPDHLARARAVIGRQLDHLSHLVDDLLDASRLTSAKIRLSRRPLELSQAVKETIETMRTRGVMNGHQLTFTGRHVWIDADETRIEQIVTNLVGNALKFTPPGGTIAVSVRNEGQRALLTVKDTGVGIPADVLPTIFDLFVQSERSLDRSQGGLGIGLTLVRRLVELHGGTVQAASDGAGLGSTFSVHLPLIPAPNVHAGKQIPVIAAACKPRRVLIVEDNDDSREMLNILLAQDGHEVHVAHDGPSGLRAALTFRPEIGLLDLGLPGFDGYALARSIRAHDEGKQIYLVALTGYGQSEDRLRSEEAGFDDHLMKPLDINQLALLLRRIH